MHSSNEEITVPMSRDLLQKCIDARLDQLVQEIDDLDMATLAGCNRRDELEMEQRQLAIVTRNMQLPEWGDGLA